MDMALFEATLDAIQVVFVKVELVGVHASLSNGLHLDVGLIVLLLDVAHGGGRGGRPFR